MKKVIFDCDTRCRISSCLILDEGHGNRNVDVMMKVDPKDYVAMWTKYLGE